MRVEETGVIIKALSGFYYVLCGDRLYQCRGRGKLRMEGVSPLVGDRVGFIPGDGGDGSVTRVLPRTNRFFRPAVANIDAMVILASAVNPVTDPFLIDRMTVIAENAGCSVILCINKSDLDPGDSLFEIYSLAGYAPIRTSALTGQGLDSLRSAIRGKVCAFSGNSGVGKSSLLNALSPGLGIQVGEVSDKLGRGRHTTRHVELFPLGEGAYIADTPGFSSFDTDQSGHIPKQRLQFCFPDFSPYLGRCRFDDCAHISEPGCALLQALDRGEISPSRHASYARLWEAASKVKDWELKKNGT